MKILILSFYYQPDLCAGSFRTTALVGSLGRKLPPDAEIEIITTLPNRYSSYSEDAPSFERSGNVTIHRIALPAHQSGMWDQAKAFSVFARKALVIANGANYTMVFATSSRLMTGVLGVVIARRQSTSLYLDFRDIFVDTLADVLPRKVSFLLVPVLSLLERFTVSGAQRVNLVSEGFKEYFNSKYPQIAYRYFTNGIDLEFIDAAPTTKTLSNSSRTTVLYAGNIGEGQGLHKILPRLISSLERKNVTFRIIGDGGRKNALITELSKIGCTNFEILPPVNRTQLISEYQAADVLFLHLNDYDAFLKVLPSKVFEYGALGKPVWAGVSGYAASFVRDNVSNSSVFAPCDVEAALVGFSSLNLSTEPREEFVEKYSRSNIMDALASDIVSVASGKVA